MMIPNTKKRRRQRHAIGSGYKNDSHKFSQIVVHIMVVSIYSIITTTDAFRVPSSTQIGFVSSRPAAKPIDSVKAQRFPSSSSSLYVLSSPRRLKDYSSGINTNLPPPIDITTNTNIPSPIDITTNLMVDFPEKNGGNSPAMISKSTSLVSSATSISTIQPPSTTEEVCTNGKISGAALKSSLFRRPSSSGTEKDTREDNHFQISSKAMTEALTDQKGITNTNLPTSSGQKRKVVHSEQSTITEVTTVEELDQYWPRCPEEGEEREKVSDPDQPVDYNKLLREMSVKGDTQIIGSKDHPEFVHPVVRLMYERKRQQEEINQENDEKRGSSKSRGKTKKDKIALVVEGGGMRGCVSAGMVCAIHCLGLSDTIDVVYGSSAGAVIAAYFVSKQLPYFGPEVYYDSLTTMEDSTATNNIQSKQTVTAYAQSKDNHNGITQQQEFNDCYSNDYFIDTKRMTRSMGLGLCDPRLLKDVWKRRVHGKPMMNLHYMFDNIMLKKKRLDYETFVKRQKIQPLKVVATGLSSEKPVILSHEDGHFDTIEDVCNSLHASCLLPGIAGPVMNVLKRIRRRRGKNSNQKTHSQEQKPNFVLRSTHRERNNNDEDYEPLGDAMLSAPIPYDIAHDEGATHVLVIRSSPDGSNLLAVPSVMAWIGSKIFKRYFLKKNHLPGMYKRSQTEQRHQRVYAKTILELNERANSPPSYDSSEDQTMTIALEPGSDEVSHLETTREGIFKGVRQGFARAYDALVEDPAMRGKGKEMAMVYFPDEILDYNPNDARLSAPAGSKNTPDFRSDFEKYLSSTGTMPKTWLESDEGKHHSKTVNTTG